jgi:diphthamide biosynthesis protein 4
MTRPYNAPSHYEILALPPPHSQVSAPNQAAFKAAYHRALLNHHPDKSHSATIKGRYTIDEITIAYRVLSDTTTRGSYDQSLLTSARKTSKLDEDGALACEVVDLDELTYDDNEHIWHRGCRCGQNKGFSVTEHQLEHAIDEGEREVVTGCGGCSLRIRVLFGVVDGG